MSGLLIDFSPIKTGGGAQLALNFARALEDVKFDRKVYYLYPDSGILASTLPDYAGEFVFTVPTNSIKRIIYEKTRLQKIIKDHKIKTIYTFFGPGLPRPSDVKSIVGVAYPIICYPDSKFWIYSDFKLRCKQKVVNYLRKTRLKSSSLIIAETEVMKERLRINLDLPEGHFIVVPPTVTEYVNECEPRKDFNFRFLFLSGISQHKNLWRLNQIVKVVDTFNLKIKFIISVSKSEFLSSLKDKDIYFDLIDKYFEFTGPIPSEKISTLYDSCDVMVNLSDLESFSNNYMEAWKSGIPIVASDRDFAREICKDSAIYVEPHSPESVVAGLKRISEDPALRYELASNGKNLLKKLPTMGERINLLLELFSDEKKN